MPSTPVEAHSLSSLTQIAGNPPRYPRNPAEQKREPLVLYIARVPGSQDVILTPLKPDLKNLKEIDVTSSLYYLHRDLPSDAALLPLEPRPAPEPQIARKPLPDVSPLSIAEKDKRDLAALQQLNQTRASYLAETSTSAPQRSPAPSPRPSTETAPPLPRRPHGPRPLSTGPPPTRRLSPSPNKENTPSPRPSTATSLARLRATSLLPIPPPQPTTLTLIRRDPLSGGQWNIGTITIPRPSSLSTPISIHLTTPGYAHFTPTPLLGFHRQILPFRRPGHLRTISAPSPATPSAYALTSPWNGRCEFRTGAAGRSLTCRHTPAGAEAQEALVSELRYSMPAAQLFAGAALKRRSRMGGWAGRPLSFVGAGEDGDGDGDGEGRFGLNLGREKAGGGSGGGRAKLGKLIVYDEGLKMMDLCVAANMGIWWEGWEGRGGGDS